MYWGQVRWDGDGLIGMLVTYVSLCPCIMLHITPVSLFNLIVHARWPMHADRCRIVETSLNINWASNLGDAEMGDHDALISCSSYGARVCHWQSWISFLIVIGLFNDDCTTWMTTPNHWQHDLCSTWTGLLFVFIVPPGLSCSHLRMIPQKAACAELNWHK